MLTQTVQGLLFTSCLAANMVDLNSVWLGLLGATWMLTCMQGHACPILMHMYIRTIHKVLYIEYIRTYHTVGKNEHCGY